MTIRENIVANAFWGADNEPEIHYSQGGHRYDALSTPYALPLYTDCSGFATLCYAWAGAPDPNGLDYNGSGYTGTLLGHLPEISMEQAQIGDLIVYGPGTGDHVVIIVATGEDPVVVSHGQERGPVRTRHSIEKSGHKSPVRVLQGLSETVEQGFPHQAQQGDDMTVGQCRDKAPAGSDGGANRKWFFYVGEDQALWARVPTSHVEYTRLGGIWTSGVQAECESDGSMVISGRAADGQIQQCVVYTDGNTAQPPGTEPFFELLGGKVYPPTK